MTFSTPSGIPAPPEPESSLKIESSQHGYEVLLQFYAKGALSAAPPAEGFAMVVVTDDDVEGPQLKMSKTLSSPARTVVSS